MMLKYAIGFAIAFLALAMAVAANADEYGYHYGQRPPAVTYQSPPVVTTIPSGDQSWVQTNQQSGATIILPQGTSQSKHTDTQVRPFYNYGTTVGQSQGQW